MTTNLKNIRELVDSSAEKYAKNLAFIVKEKINGKACYDNIDFMRLCSHKIFKKEIMCSL